MARTVKFKVRLYEEDYIRLKEEAARIRKSLSSVIRDKLSDGQKMRSEKEKGI